MVGMPELVIILLVVLILFGPKNLPKLGSMFGHAARDAKRHLDDAVDDDTNAEDEKR